MVDIPALRGEMAKNNVSQIQMAKTLGIAPKTFYNKMKNGSFGCDEALIISNTLNITDPASIFFANE
jgi:DNA-binding XRE family transcriptional regulator